MDLAAENWCLASKGYAAKRHRGRLVYLHKVIAERMGLHGQVDHEDRNKLNCRRSNLRSATNQQNSANRVKQPNNASGYKGVSWHVKAKKWQAYIHVGNSKRHLGSFGNVIEAAKAYNSAAVAEFGVFAQVNEGVSQDG